MPCRDDGPSRAEEEASAARRDLRQRDAMLCGVLAVLEQRGIANMVIEQVDYQEAGISVQDLHGWWKQHKAEDEARRAREAAARQAKERQEALVSSALNKLSAEEWDALTKRIRGGNGR
jgi:arsenate reductase-like glutaredoxin family protein